MFNVIRLTLWLIGAGGMLMLEQGCPPDRPIHATEALQGERPAGRPAGMRDRRRRLALIHAAKRQIGLDDPAYRALLAGAAGVESAADLATDAQFSAVMSGLRAAGWHGTGRLKGQMATCYAHWQSLHESGAVRNGSYQALLAYIGRMCGDQDIYRADQLSMVIETLKQWEGRLGAVE